MAYSGNVGMVSNTRGRRGTRPRSFGSLALAWFGWRALTAYVACTVHYLRTPLVIVHGRKALCYFTAGAAGVILGTCLWWLAFDRSVPVELLSGTVSPNPVTPGATVHIHLNLREHRVCPGSIERRIIDTAGEVHTYVDTGTVYVNEAPADQVSIDREFPIPTAIHPGTWYYQPIAKWYCNPMQYWWPIIVVQKAVPFEVQGVPAELQQQLDTKQQKHLEYIPLPRPNARAMQRQLARGTE